MISIKKLAGRHVVASCLPGVPALRSTCLSGATEARLVERGRSVINVRPTKAPAAVAKAPASAYAFAAKGAGLQQTWIGGGFAAGVSATEHHTMRAFRGLQPWRDPA